MNTLAELRAAVNAAAEGASNDDELLAYAEYVEALETVNAELLAVVQDAAMGNAEYDDLSARAAQVLERVR